MVGFGRKAHAVDILQAVTVTVTVTKRVFGTYVVLRNNVIVAAICFTTTGTCMYVHGGMRDIVPTCQTRAVLFCASLCAFG